MLLNCLRVIQAGTTFGWLGFLLLALCTNTTGSLAMDSNATQCPTWYIPVHPGNDSMGQCKCGSSPYGVVQCNQDKQEVSIASGYCMTQSRNDLNKTVVGYCPYHMYSRSGYRHLPRNVSELDSRMCGPMNREGQLCGQCKPGHSPGISSYSSMCIVCASGNSGVIIFLVTQICMTTVFFVFVVVFQISASSGALCTYVLYSQVASIPAVASYMQFVGKMIGPKAETFTKLLISTYGIWNLDFLRPFLPDYCLHEDATELHVLAMWYFIPAYLLFLMVFVYVGMQFHARNCRPIVSLWKPLHPCFTRFRRRWNTSPSIIDAFATLLLLSYTKVVFISFRIIYGVQLFYPSGHMSSKVYVLFRATLGYAGKEHLPFFVLASLLIVIVGLLPVFFLAFYQFRWFQRCLQKCRMECQGLRAFTEALQGSYKNGLHNRPDCRYFAAINLILRMIAAFMKVSEYTNSNVSTTISFTLGVLSVCCILLFALIRPYRRPLYNVIDSFFFGLFTITIFAYFHFETIQPRGNGHSNKAWEVASYKISLALWSIPMVYFVAIVFYYLFVKIKGISCCGRTWSKLCKNILDYRSSVARKAPSRDSVSRETSTGISGSLPDRVLRPCRYQSIKIQELEETGTN